jgi:hypothetical protein
MILSDKIKPVLLDWTSESRALPAIINYLNNTSQMVNVVDLSNMLEWTYSDDSLRRLAANLRTIPTHMDAVVLSTDAFSPGTYYRGWTYTVRYLDLFADMSARPNWQDHLAEPGGILRKNCWMTWLGLQ